MTNRTAHFLAGIGLGTLLMTGAAQAQYIRLGQPQIGQVPGQAAGQAAWQEAGQASWYGGRHQGRRTSSGEVFNQNAMTAAHPRLPLGSRVRVTMADTGSSVVVTITDRQPDHGRRIIDLSRGAAARIGLLSQGTGNVTLASVAADEPVEVAEAPDDGMDPSLSPRPHGRLHTRRGALAAAAGRRSNQQPFAIQVRHSVQRQATRHTL